MLDGSVSVSYHSSRNLNDRIHRYEVLNPSNCDTATVTIFIEAELLPSIALIKSATLNDLK
jgi:hypothetical protein